LSLAIAKVRIRLVVDTEQRRPACVLLQAAYGGDAGAVSMFDPGTWLVAPTPAMQMFAGTREQWSEFAKVVNAKARRK